jgi:hypothetical protein
MYNTLPLINTRAILFTTKVVVNLLLRPHPRSLPLFRLWWFAFAHHPKLVEGRDFQRQGRGGYQRGCYGEEKTTDILLVVGSCRDNSRVVPTNPKMRGPPSSSLPSFVSVGYLPHFPEVKCDRIASIHTRKYGWEWIGGMICTKKCLTFRMKLGNLRWKKRYGILVIH